MDTKNSLTNSASTALGKILCSTRNLIASTSVIALVVATLTIGFVIPSPVLASEGQGDFKTCGGKASAKAEKYYRQYQADQGVGSTSGVFDIKSSYANLKKAAEAGCEKALLTYGRIALDGEPDLPQDIKLACKYLKKLKGKGLGAELYLDMNKGHCGS